MLAFDVFTFAIQAELDDTNNEAELVDPTAGHGGFASFGFLSAFGIAIDRTDGAGGTSADG